MRGKLGNFAVETFVDGNRCMRQTSEGEYGEARIKVYVRLPSGAMKEILVVGCTAWSDCLMVQVYGETQVGRSRVKVYETTTENPVPPELLYTPVVDSDGGDEEPGASGVPGSP